MRKKLEAETGKQYIQTEPWVGYRFIPDGWSATKNNRLPNGKGLVSGRNFTG